MAGVKPCYVQAVRMAWLASAAVVCACAEPVEVIDPYPVEIDLDGGMPILGVRATGLASDAGVLRAVIDTASAVTVLDDGAGAATTRRRLNLELVRAPLPPAGPAIARAQFTRVAALVGPVASVGTGAPEDIAAVIGADVLSRVAVRFDPAQSQLRFFHDVPGSDAEQEATCLAVIHLTLVGQGSYIVGGDAVGLAATRVVLGACLNPDPLGDTAPTVASGGDTLLLLATGVGPTILSRTTYEAARGVDDPAVDALPTTALHLPGDTSPSGDTVHVGRLHRMALVGRVAGRGPCTELARARGIALCPAEQAAAGACARTTCTTSVCAGASIELGDEIDVLVVEDTDPLLQGLRNELRPAVADIGGLLGMRALAPLVLDVDYPGSRVLVRCAAPGGTCVTRPRVTGPDTAREIELRGLGCL